MIYNALIIDFMEYGSPSVGEAEPTAPEKRKTSRKKCGRLKIIYQ